MYLDEDLQATLKESKKSVYIKFIQWFAFLMICLASSSANKPCNDFLDDVLQQMKAEKEFFHEPYEIPEGQRSFAIYELEFGHVYGLSTLHRTGDVFVRNKGGDKQIRVHLGAGELQLKSSIKRKFLSFGNSANVDANVPFVTMELDVLPRSDGSEPVIDNFKVDEVKGMNLKFSGGGVIKDFVRNTFTKAFGRFFKNTVKYTFEDRISRFLKDKVKDLTIPEACLNDSWD